MFAKGLLLAALLSQALPALAALHERVSVPTGWKPASIIPRDDAPILLSVGLVKKNIEQLEAKLKDVSTPGSSNYGEHMLKDEVDTFFAPSAQANKKIRAWLEGAGVKFVSSDEQSITFRTTVDTANKLLKTRFMHYENDGVLVLRTTEYSVPNHLKRYIDIVSPTTYFGATNDKTLTYTKVKSSERPSRRRSAVDSSCSAGLTPACVKQLYNVGNYTPCATSGSKIGFGAFELQAARYDDLAAFEKLFNIPSQNLTVNTVNGGINQQNTSNCCMGEANIDLQIIMGIAHPIPVTEYIVGGVDPGIRAIDGQGLNNDEIDPFLPYYQYLLSQPDSLLPQVIVDSYGNEEQAVPHAYAKRVCNLIGLLGLRGVSVLIASGDYGTGRSCKSNDGKNTTKFLPVFPASCPWVTSVGGTQDLDRQIAWGPEYGIGGSSGGFSEYFACPWYQRLAVSKYLSSYISSATKKYYDPYVNFKGRGFPDIAAHSDFPAHFIVNRNVTQLYGSGNSAAAPMVAAIIALLNDARLRAGKSSLGFLNPLLYAIDAIDSGGLTDIVGGGSGGCTGMDPYNPSFNSTTLTGPIDPARGIVPYASWNATVGWDPVTGLGIPDFRKLKAIVLSY